MDSRISIVLAVMAVGDDGAHPDTVVAFLLVCVDEVKCYERSHLGLFALLRKAGSRYNLTDQRKGPERKRISFWGQIGEFNTERATEVSTIFFRPKE